MSQELNLFGDLDVLANLFPMREPRRGPFVRRAEMAERARPVLAELGLDVPLRTPVGSLPLASASSSRSPGRWSPGRAC